MVNFTKEILKIICVKTQVSISMLTEIRMMVNGKRIAEMVEAKYNFMMEANYKVNLLMIKLTGIWIMKIHLVTFSQIAKKMLVLIVKQKKRIY